MKITIVGSGYVGLVTGACFSEVGIEVACVDIDQKKINALNKGEIPIHEVGLESLVQQNTRKGRLFFSTSLVDVLDRSDLIFIAVGTPSDQHGHADLQYVRAVAKEIGKYLKKYTVVINKSTVPPGTGKMVEEIIREKYAGDFDVVSCPEFLQEGTGVNNFFHPDRIVIGTRNEKAAKTMLDAFKNIRAEKLLTTVESAEMIKYASNAFLASKISFINEIANLCEPIGADVDDVAYGMGLDTRIGPKFLRAGLGYGGSCFPKDVRALHQIADGHQYDFKLLKSVIEVNNLQRRIVIEKLKKTLGSIRGKTIAVLGLTFKSNTDDVRESASIEIIEMLIAKGARIKGYDPIGSKNAKKIMPELTIEESIDKTIKNADAIVLATEWDEFKHVDWEQLRPLLKQPILIDARNLLDPNKIRQMGYSYECIGRNGVLHKPAKQKVL